MLKHNDLKNSWYFQNGLNTFYYCNIRATSTHVSRIIINFEDFKSRMKYSWIKKKTMNFPSQSFYGKNILENYNISTNIIISFDQRCQGTMVTSKM